MQEYEPTFLSAGTETNHKSVKRESWLRWNGRGVTFVLTWWSTTAPFCKTKFHVLKAVLQRHLRFFFTLVNKKLSVFFPFEKPSNLLRVVCGTDKCRCVQNTRCFCWPAYNKRIISRPSGTNATRGGLQLHNAKCLAPSSESSRMHQYVVSAAFQGPVAQRFSFPSS